MTPAESFAANGRGGDSPVEQQVGLLLEHRRLITRMALGAAIATVIWGSLRPRTYTSDSAFIPQAWRPPTAVAGLAAQLGLTPGGEGGFSPAFYASLLESRPMLDSLGATRLNDGGSSSATAPELLDRLEIRGPTEGVRRLRGAKALARAVSVTVNQRTGTLGLAVSMPTPGLARGANARLLELLNRFNVETRQSQARAERVFAEQRLKEVATSLRQAEEELQAFLERNRSYENSPSLRFRQERLARAVDRQQQVYTTLSQAFEQARLDEVRDTPVFTVLEPPVLPALPDPRHRLRNGLLAAVLGGVAGMFLAFGLGYLAEGDGRRYDVPDLVRATGMDLVRPWRLVVGGASGGRKRGAV